MRYVNQAAGEVNFKIVYAGPGFGGKSTSLSFIHDKTAPDRRSRVFQLNTKTERAIFFDVLPEWLPPVGGLKPRFHVWTIPGVAFESATRELVLKAADGIVFVADSQEARSEANVESLAELARDLAANRRDLHGTPMVIQYNKRDVPDALSVGELDVLLAAVECLRFESVATVGIGVFDALKAVAKAIVEQQRAKLDLSSG